MEILEVTNSKAVKEFNKLPIRLYKGDKHWIRPLIKDAEAVFDPKINSFFGHGVCTRWILRDNSGNTIGRIAAFINEETAKQPNSKGILLRVGGLGFFECEDDASAAKVLFDTAKKWLKEKKCNAIDGPINFGERLNWWGLLIEGHDVDPNYKMPYTKPYYQALFEDYGFQIYFKQLTYGRKVNDPMLPVYQKVAERLFNDPKYRFTTIDPAQMEKFTKDFCDIYNLAWAGHEGVKEMSIEQATTQMKELKQILDPNIVYFAYYDDKPVAFYINIPELNQIIKHIKHGKLDLWGLAKFIWYLKVNRSTKMMGLVFGVIPEFQRKGVMLGLVEYCRRIVQGTKRGKYIDYEMNWIGDFNPKMVKISDGIGKPIKVHHTYRIILDSTIEFERCQEIG